MNLSEHLAAASHPSPEPDPLDAHLQTMQDILGPESVGFTEDHHPASGQEMPTPVQHMTEPFHGSETLIADARDQVQSAFETTPEATGETDESNEAPASPQEDSEEVSGNLWESTEESSENTWDSTDEEAADETASSEAESPRRLTQKVVQAYAHLRGSRAGEVVSGVARRVVGTVKNLLQTAGRKVSTTFSRLSTWYRNERRARAWMRTMKKGRKEAAAAEAARAAETPEPSPIPEPEPQPAEVPETISPAQNDEERARQIIAKLKLPDPTTNPTEFILAMNMIDRLGARAASQGDEILPGLDITKKQLQDTLEPSSQQTEVVDPDIIWLAQYRKQQRDKANEAINGRKPDFTPEVRQLPKTAVARLAAEAGREDTARFRRLAAEYTATIPADGVATVKGEYGEYDEKHPQSTRFWIFGKLKNNVYDELATSQEVLVLGEHGELWDALNIVGLDHYEVVGDGKTLSRIIDHTVDTMPRRYVQYRRNGSNGPGGIVRLHSAMNHMQNQLDRFSTDTV